jgi:hypothetical protein
LIKIVEIDDDRHELQKIDVHQHLLTEPLIEELAARREAPALVRHRDGWTFKLNGEPDSLLARRATDVAQREEEMREDGVDRALVALSSALGIESLSAAEAAPLLDAYHRGVEALPSPFGAWGALGLDSPDPGDVDALIGRGYIGVSMPATALASPGALNGIGPVLERLEQLDAPLFVHPGPVANTADDPTSLPGWWPGMTDYVAQMQAAWFAFFVTGRSAHPRLRVLFAMLAGGAPLQLERLAARGGTAPDSPDSLLFYDTSSYGPRMLRAMVAAVGARQLVHGSDRPVAGARVPPADTALGHALLSANPKRLLHTKKEFPG